MTRTNLQPLRVAITGGTSGLGAALVAELAGRQPFRASSVYAMRSSLGNCRRNSISFALGGSVMSTSV